MFALPLATPVTTADSTGPDAAGFSAAQPANTTAQNSAAIDLSSMMRLPETKKPIVRPHVNKGETRIPRRAHLQVVLASEIQRHGSHRAGAQFYWAIAALEHESPIAQ
jgi:hypothetical protein